MFGPGAGFGFANRPGYEHNMFGLAAVDERIEWVPIG
jgi:hypothetical protein